jgi:antitoxin FitA
MAILQVKSMPDELYAALGKRAKLEGVSMSEYVIRTLRKDLSRPSTREWLDRVERRLSNVDLVNVDTVAVLDEIRGPWPDEPLPPLLDDEDTPLSVQVLDQIRGPWPGEE